MITLATAAKTLGIAADTLRQQIHAGRLEAQKIGPIWVISEIALDRYRLSNLGRVGRPFVGRLGYVDTSHVGVRLLFAPADGRGHDSIWIQYLQQSFVLDLDLENPKPFRWNGEPYQTLEPETAPPGGRRIELWNRQNVARELQTRADVVDVLLSHDATFPKPAVTFHDGPVWDAERVDRWRALQRPADRPVVQGAPD